MACGSENASICWQRGQLRPIGNRPVRFREIQSILKNSLRQKPVRTGSMLAAAEHKPVEGFQSLRPTLAFSVKVARLASRLGGPSIRLRKFCPDCRQHVRYDVHTNTAAAREAHAAEVLTCSPARYISYLGMTIVGNLGIGA